MTQPPKRPPATGYRLRVAGHLDHHWSSWFGDLTLTQDVDGSTSLTGDVADQAELHGLLTKIRDLGVTLLSVETVTPHPGVDDDADAHPHAVATAPDAAGTPPRPIAAPKITGDSPRCSPCA